MIPRAYITEWRSTAAWITDAQVEQDLVLTRLISEIYSNKLLSDNLLFRGGTALHKLYSETAPRYSEDIDLVQIKPGPIGILMTEIRKICDPFLGVPKWKQTEARVTITYRVSSEIPPVVPMKFKIEINTREHFSVFGIVNKEFHINSRWYSNKCTVKTYSLNELLGTKMRALYQRKKGRDLFDLWYMLSMGKTDSEKIVTAFRKYIEHQGVSVSGKIYLHNLKQKIKDPDFGDDMEILLRTGIKYSVSDAFELIHRELIEKLS